VFWRRRKQDEPAPDQDLEPTVEPVEPEDEAEAAQDALIPADEAPIDDDLEPEVEPEPEPPIEEPVAPSASPFAQPGWSASSMAAAPAQDRERRGPSRERANGHSLGETKLLAGDGQRDRRRQGRRRRPGDHRAPW